ncbi:hypothetical protein [Dethiobacter alkaliphilus]|uniref:Lipoprotein n=1 Tax=Dethiobacter alkaliphilus AHT 1 TaxID=555088 RepID=C0GHV3_DETAL|nr:hypothetical protein [Dethiobacter alkaliphilus]EEG77027.1 hypothetical protein DealDRAFT_2062 [Dethiobacter alkaliphilus AHT 1]
MKKLAFLSLILVLFAAGCSRSFDKNAAGYVSSPTSMQFFLEDNLSVTVKDKDSIQNVMAVLNEVEVNKLTVEESNQIVMQGQLLEATEMRFRDRQGKVFRAYLLSDGSLLVMEGDINQGGKQRDVFLSAPNQQELYNEIQASIMTQMKN